ncbi:hypothetical protein FA15DRAFT_708290 [Coprinopsis marcescibilis]|uniref:Ubiquitin-like domain-containing protein n=1 Tax=Coprinopsis marcescibilis TaxID=230819 RepID=A0A5C3KJV8_COPMA|nr:hypothetical protein FA15DRAFT_708290 [Coprinopsis marcescibilis]
MQTPPQIPKPILKRLFSRFNTTFRRQNERPAIGVLISQSTQISTQLGPHAIESESGPRGVSIGRRVLQTVTVVADVGASVAEAVPGGTIVKGALDALGKVLKVVEVRGIAVNLPKLANFLMTMMQHNLQNKEDVAELRSKIDELVDVLSESAIPAGDVAFEARQRRLVRKLRAKAEELEELLEDPSASIRSQAISQAIAACCRDVESFKTDFLILVNQHLAKEMAKQTAALEVFVELQQSGPSMRFLATVKVMDPLGRPHMVPREFVNAFKDIGQYILDQWSSNRNVQEILAPYIREGMYDLTINSGENITEIATGNKLYVAEPNETIVMSVVEFRRKFHAARCSGCGNPVSFEGISDRYTW